MREYVIENEFVKAVRKAGGVAYKLNSLTANGLPDRLVLFFPARTVFVELKAPGKQMRPLQRKRRYQLQKLGFPVLCIDQFSQIQPCIEAILAWNPGEPFPEGIGAKVPDLETAILPTELADITDMETDTAIDMATDSAINMATETATDMAIDRAIDMDVTQGDMSVDTPDMLEKTDHAVMEIEGR